MGLEQTVAFPGGVVPAWHQVQELLGRHAVPVQIRMIEDQLAFPDEMPAEAWRELRVGSAAGMVTIRRGTDRITLVTWGNADVPLLRMRNALTWAFAEVGAGRIQGEDKDQMAPDFLLSADVPAGLRRE